MFRKKTKRQMAVRRLKKYLRKVIDRRSRLEKLADALAIRR